MIVTVNATTRRAKFSKLDWLDVLLFTELLSTAAQDNGNPHRRVRAERLLTDIDPANASMLQAVLPDGSSLDSPSEDRCP